MTAPLPVTEVFEFFEDARNLGRITPKWLNFRILNPEGIRMKAGAEINYVIGWMGVPIKWKTVIKAYEPPDRFIDGSGMEVKPGYKQTDAGVIIRDRVDYRLPFGIFGRMAHAILVKRQLLEIFRYRQATIARILNVPGITFDTPSVTAKV